MKLITYNFQAVKLTPLILFAGWCLYSKYMAVAMGRKGSASLLNRSRFPIQLSRLGSRKTGGGVSIFSPGTKRSKARIRYRSVYFTKMCSVDFETLTENVDNGSNFLSIICLHGLIREKLFGTGTARSVIYCMDVLYVFQTT